MSPVAGKLVLEVLASSDTNPLVQPQKMATGSKFGLQKNKDCAILEEKTKALINLHIYILVFTFAKKSFLVHDMGYDKVWILHYITNFIFAAIKFHVFASIHSFEEIYLLSWFEVYQPLSVILHETQYSLFSLRQYLAM